MEVFVLNQNSLKRFDGTVTLNDQVIMLDREDLKALVEIHRINGKGPAEYLEMAKSLGIKESQVEMLEGRLREYEK
ncbi:MAG: hypothetical protein ACK5L6_06125 [Anaerorhabdus sp.]|uniref:hypothetical protein n=1 Tax=Anaerorhabdus sp. TaxID=1872524 RepID=UPI003A889F32